MLIDWFTVGAQALNFLILIWLMKRFLYQPILDAIDAREKRIADELADADAKRESAQQEQDVFRKKNKAFEQQRETRLAQMEDEVNAERQHLMAEARKESEALLAKHQSALRIDAHNLNQEITRLAQHEVFAIARKTLSDLAAVDLEDRMVEAFVRRLKEIDKAAIQTICDALDTMSGAANVRSAFDLSGAQRQVIQSALNQIFSRELNLRYQASPDLVSGIEFATDGQKISWSIASYLASMEKEVDGILKSNASPGAT